MSCPVGILQYEHYNLGPEYCRFYTEKEVYGEKVRQIYFLLVLTLVYIIPFILTISAYTTILHTLFRQFYKELQFRYWLALSSTDVHISVAGEQWEEISEQPGPGAGGEELQQCSRLQQRTSAQSQSQGEGWGEVRESFSFSLSSGLQPQSGLRPRLHRLQCSLRYLWTCHCFPIQKCSQQVPHSYHRYKIQYRV